MDALLDNVVLLMPMSKERFAVDCSPHRRQITIGLGNNLATQNDGLVDAVTFAATNTTSSSSTNQSVMRVTIPQLGSAPWTIEMWQFTSTGGKGSHYPRWLQIGNNSVNGLLYWTGTTVTDVHRILCQGRVGNVTTNMANDYSAPNNVWNHFALQWDGTKYRLYHNGLVVREAVRAVIPVTETRVHIGANNSNAEALNGRIRDLRITAGVARYPDEFTPPPIGSLVLETPILLIGPTHSISGKANVNTTSGPPVEKVLVFDTSLGVIVAEATPDASGNWSVSVPAGDYHVAYLSEGCQPVLHGSYTVEAP